MPEVRLIDANALKRHVKTECNKYGKPTIGFEDGCKVLKMIDDEPTIEPEARRGRWMRRETVLDNECKCSVCGYKDFVPKHDNYWFRRKFCPNCGADMREEGADNG